jgi:hypothetical protein
MKTLPETILSHALALPEGGVLSPREFLHLGRRAAVDQAFSRLTRAGKLLRLARGVYVRPVESRMFGPHSPSSSKVIQFLAEQTGETIVPQGASAANVLGLTTQNPVREIYLTSGHSRVLRFGRHEVLLKQAPAWKTALGMRPAGLAVRALEWMGPEHIQKALTKLRATLPGSEWSALVNSRSMLPGWMAQAIGREAIRD